MLAVQSVAVVVNPVSFDGSAIVHSFNADPEKPRLVVILSPTCGHCLQACSDVQELLEDHPAAPIRVTILWSPFQPGDNIGMARRAAETYISDPRVVHLWDIWKFGARSYSQRFRLMVENTWGIFMFFKPGVPWTDEPPAPEFWMQSRNLPVGTPFSKGGLKRRLRDWLETGVK